MEELLVKVSDVTNQIVANPGVAADRDNQLIQEYLSLVEPESDYAEAALAGWVEDGGQGVWIGPLREGTPASVEALDGDLETVSADEVRFATCVTQTYLAYDAQGRVTERVDGLQLPGQGTAVRVDGEWKVRRLDVFTGTAGCGGASA